MKVLILGLNFAPELTGVGRYTADFAAWLSARGHEVRVITAPPYYPEWRVAAGYASWAWRRDHAGAAWVRGAATFPARVMHLFSFGLSSLLPCLWQAIRFRPDLVWVVEPTALAAPAALLAAKLCGARACLHVQDLEVEAACRLGMVRTPWLRRLLGGAYGWLVRRFDLVSTICMRMRGRLRHFGVAESRLCLFPNWVDTDAIRPLTAPSILRRHWAWPNIRSLRCTPAAWARSRDSRCWPRWPSGCVRIRTSTWCCAVRARRGPGSSGGSPGAPT